tara:strand:+ start:365 stop:934 length:570 start_codon:yes stop_codon:yes gene_type:complete
VSRDLTPSTINNIEQDIVHPFFAVELLFESEQLRIWTGLGTLTTSDGNEWLGTGTLLDISTVEETSEIASKGANITISGMTSEVVSLALSEPYQGRVCNIYFGAFDNGDQTTALSNFNEIFSGYMDQMNISEGPETATLEILVENKLVDLERVRIARWTSAYQKSKYPNDNGLNFVEDLQDKDIKFGRS